jgi:membrane-anchored mycosin MYCP
MPGRSLARGRDLARTGLAVGVVVLAGLAGPAPAALAVPAPAPAPQPAFGQRCAPPATVVVRQVPWAQQRLATQRAWRLSQGGGVTVAVIYSGVDARVPQLAGHVLPGVDVVGSTTFDGAVVGRGGRADSDCLGHGTFVASIIAAQPVAGIGFAGIAPGAQILPVRQTNTGQDGTGSGMAAAIRAATDRGAAVINISAASSIPSQQLADAVKYAQRHDVLIVAAADNQAKEGDPRSYPASYPGVVAVGSISQEGRRSDFSETGDFIDLVAPGAGVLGLGTGGPGHLVGDGTSFAAPFVAGVAALVRAYRPALHADQVARRLELTADHPGVQLPDRQVGWGVVNPYAALATELAEEEPAPQAGEPSPLVEPTPVPVDHTARDRGLLVAGISLAALLLVGILAFVLPRGRRRGWRPGRVEPDRVEGGRVERDRVERDRVERDRVEPGRTQPGGTTPDRVEPGRSQGTQVQPEQAQPSQIQQGQIEPRRLEPAETQAGRTDAGQIQELSR